jgi:hypothetical protein
VIADGPTPGRWKGLAGLVEGWRGFLDAWEEFRSEADKYRELDDERVLVFVHYSGRGKTSGVALGDLWSKGAPVFHVRDGKVTKLVLNFNRERALADLGLTSEAGHSPS